MRPNKARVFYLKKPKAEFLCALCGTPRQMKYAKDLSLRQYIQIVVLIVSLCFFLYPLMEFKSLFFLPFVWPVYEIVHKSLYRKDLVCPHCGFDPTWYRRDVKMARKKVERFWEEKTPTTPSVNTDNPDLAEIQADQ